MARAGLCSRREADRWIADGRVVVNGVTLETPAIEVKPTDTILVDGHPLPAAAPVQLWRYHKPKHQVTTNSDPQGRPTVFDNLPKDLPRVMSIGRLDFNTEGLLLLTNDGGLARHLELPATGWLRRYKVRVHGRVSAASLARLADGVTIDGIRYGPITAALESTPSTGEGGPSSANTWLTIGLREGKNREVRRIMEDMGLTVNRLIRLSFGPFQLLDLVPGAAEPVKPHVLAEHLGRETAALFGLEAIRNDAPPDASGEQTAPPPRKPAHRAKPSERPGRADRPERREQGWSEAQSRARPNAQSLSKSPSKSLSKAPSRSPSGPSSGPPSRSYSTSGAKSGPTSGAKSGSKSGSKSGFKSGAPKRPRAK